MHMSSILDIEISQPLIGFQLLASEQTIDSICGRHFPSSYILQTEDVVLILTQYAAQ